MPRYALPARDFVVPLEPGGHVTPDVANLPPVVSPDLTTYTLPGTEMTVVVDGRAVPGAAYQPDDPDLADRVVLDFPPFTWHEEDQEVFGHPHDPFKRIDTLQSSRHIRISLDGVTLADSTRPVLLLETYLSQRGLDKLDHRGGARTSGSICSPPATNGCGSRQSRVAIRVAFGSVESRRIW